jgi:double-stranded uracil-DNA glycosylase
MDEETVATYEARAVEWERSRSPRWEGEARAFAARAGSGPVADLGCGPGWYAAVLPEPVIALDAARSMLDRAATHAPCALRVQADLEALPFRRGALAGAWANNSFVHVPQARVPLALADLHRTLRPGGVVELTFFGGTGEGHYLFPGTDLPDRFFSLWSRERLVDVVEGGGFALDELSDRTGSRSELTFVVRATRARTLPDFVVPRLRVLLVGLNPSLFAADAGVGFARPGNRFWPAALEAGLVSRARDPRHALLHHSVGMTDLVKRATVGAAELTREEYRTGFARVDRLAAWLEPAVVCFVGLAGWRVSVDPRATAGLQDRAVGGRPAYVMPNPSGLNSHATVSGLAAHLRAIAALAERGRSSPPR